jgi:AcrR family transcriptional regulator
VAETGTSPVAATNLHQGFGLKRQPHFRKLKPGPGLPQDQVAADQRRRLHGAVIQTVDRTGLGAVRVRTLARTAGVSTATFYKHFMNTDECIASAYEAVIATTVDRARVPLHGRSDWQASLHSVVAVLMEEFARDPRSSRFALVEVFGAGAVARRRIGVAVAELERLIATSFAEAPRQVAVPRHLVAGMTAGVLRVARTTTMARRGAELPRLTHDLEEWMKSLANRELLSLAPPVGAGERGRLRREAHPFPGDQESKPPVGDERDRLLRAVNKLAKPKGFSGLTVSSVRAEAGVSLRAFEACFGSLEDCFLAAIETTATEAAERARSWSTDSTGHDEWTRQTYRFVLAVCAQAARDRSQARLVFQGILGIGRDGLLRREQMIDRIAAGLRATLPVGVRPTALPIEASVAAVWTIINSDIAAGRTRGLPSVAPLLSYVLLAPIIGAGSAAAVIRSEIGPVPVAPVP